ncbi:AraC family transcriptional regulator [Olivibacter sp. CPCC 100613]|uniref:AraC family transcriptional regulator n=1 Tax=Olivibacter sp. CPCC 100613 TaxID=3079931 RepID=UPI002FF5D6EF
MKKKQLYHPFEIYISDIEHWQERPLVYHFFEIVLILKGEGFRIVNQNEFAYKAGNIFLFTPMDCRGFESKQVTHFCSIRFSEVFLTQYKNSQERQRITTWLKQLEQIFYQHNRFEPLLVKNSNDCKMITELINNLLAEYEYKRPYYEENLQYLITLILNILSRNIFHGTEKSIHTAQEEPLINKMLLHIGQYIHCKEKLKVEYLASKFNLSTNYVGEYFRKLTGESLQQYISLYKIKQVEQRLVNSELTISQIADELGFTDESHLSRQFKKYKNISPKLYRRNLKSLALTSN